MKQKTKTGGAEKVGTNEIRGRTSVPVRVSQLENVRCGVQLFSQGGSAASRLSRWGIRSTESGERSTGTARPHPNLDPMTFVGDINFTRLDFGMNFIGGFQKRLFDVVSGFGRRFQKQQPIRFGKGLSFFGRHGTFVFQIILIANEQNDHVGLRMLFRFFKPSTQMLKGITSGNVVHQQCTRRTTIIRTCDTTETFLSSRIPNLQFDLLSIRYIDHTSAKFNTNRQIVHWLESFVSELQQQARLSNACK